MVTRFKNIISLILFFIVLSGPYTRALAFTDSLVVKKALQVINAVKLKSAPDKRTEIADVQILSSEPLTLGIETTKPAIAEEIKAALDASAIPAAITVNTLPAKDLGDKIYAVADISVCNNRLAPANGAEMVSQAILGTPLCVLKKQKGYYLVSTPDKYISWIDSSVITLMDKAAFIAWQRAPKVIYTAQYGHALVHPSVNSLPVSDLVAGNILQVMQENKGFYKIRFPDGRVGYISKKEAVPFHKWLQNPVPDAIKLLATARALLGVPYLWGGTSIKGVDCSGFIKTSFFLNGIIIPRDASQQALVGKGIDIYEGDSINIAKCLKNLQPGDLLFFSFAARQDKQAKITHTAIYMGDGQFIQAAGMVKINSLKPADTNYDGYRRQRLVKAQRLLGFIGKPGITKVSDDPFYIEKPEAR
ncbi:SH3 domain-containing C40 family peptidase [Mucilaginibacter boryungensis]|uniref:C40 family peptidase n=1 Tax=Mucilaginibacter boryungensis TaxID=768480 RepID=A0ABR9XDT5_9SPHI|nr:SH3 domain-containing C40 family peptidase [Mucilaginibacter boryungensis]MBE9665553.1 C40 family peptidase [Mucilaginibacter boryungensis]